MDFAPAAMQELTVSFGSSADVKEQVRQAIDIVDLVGGYLQLRRQGRNYVALCPWHDDSRPSLQVNPERQSFKCWVCDIGGDVFSFLMRMEGIEFPEALAMLADRAGISIKQERPRDRTAQDGPGQVSAADDKRTLYKAAAWAERQYHEALLHAPEAEPARRYLTERRISTESIEQFHLGFSPTASDWLLTKVAGSPSRVRVLEAIGVLGRPQSGGRLYDRFFGRLLFSIRDAQGRPIAIGGRLLPELNMNSPAKYVNSPETPLFTKSRNLYGLDLAKDSIRKSRTALVMEGYTDVIVAHQYGFTDAVAVLGTALGEQHIRILKRFADRIVLVLDGDEAGQKRANEVLEMFIAQQVDLQVLTLPDDLDPCDFLHERGSEAFAALLRDGVVDALDHAILTASRGVDIERDVHGASRALERLIAIYAKAPRSSQATPETRLRETRALERISAKFRMPENDIRKRIAEMRQQRQSQSVRTAEPSPSETKWRPNEPLDPCERELIEVLMVQPELWPSALAQIATEQLTGSATRWIFETAGRLRDGGIPPTFDRLMIEFDDPAMKSLLVDLDEQGHAKATRTGDAVDLLGELLKAIERKEVDRQRPAQNVALREKRLDASQEIDLLRTIIEQQRNRQGISKPTDGQGYPEPSDPSHTDEF